MQSGGFETKNVILAWNCNQFAGIIEHNTWNYYCSKFLHFLLTKFPKLVVVTQFTGSNKQNSSSELPNEMCIPPPARGKWGVSG